jgi:enoyl-CoA hydratase/carnithine racemase
VVDSVLLDALLPLIGPDRVHVFAFQRDADHFAPDRETECQAEATLLRAGATCRQPVLFLARGITADGRMLFLAFADRALATTEATFGFPSVRRGAATLATAALRKRAPLQRIRRWVFIGETFDVATARRSGLVELIFMRETTSR